MTVQDQITQKYQPVFQEMERRQVKVNEMRMEGNKLYVLGQAPSEDAKNKVWDVIKQIDPSYSDLTMDIRTGQQADPHAQFDQIASGAGPQGLAQGLAEAFRSDQTPPFSQMVSHLFGQSNGQQKAGLLNSLFSLTPSSLASEVLGTAHSANQQVTPEQADKVPPEAVQKLAERAQQHDGSVVDRISQYYAQHPGLVKTLGVGALSVLTSKIVGGLRRRA